MTSQERKAAEIERMLQNFFEDTVSEAEKKESEKYLRLRIRPVMERLIEQEDTERLEKLEAFGWFGAVQLDAFIQAAAEKRCISSLVWLLKLKKEKYGYKDKDFSL